MAEKEAHEGYSEPVAKKKGKLKLVLIPLVLILLGAIAFGGVKMGFISIPGLAWNKGPSGTERGDKQSKASSSLGTLYSMQPFIVNLADESTGRYLKVRFEVEVDNERVISEIEKRIAQLSDSVIMLLSSKTSREIASYEGKDRMRNELILRLNSFLTTGSIQNIYFTEFMMQ